MKSIHTLLILSLSLLFWSGCDNNQLLVSAEDEAKIELISDQLDDLYRSAGSEANFKSIVKYRKDLFNKWKASYSDQPTGLALRKGGSLPHSSVNATMSLDDLKRSTDAPFPYYVSRLNLNNGIYEYTYHNISIPLDSIYSILNWPVAPFEFVSTNDEGDTLFVVAGISSTYTPLLNFMKDHFGLVSDELGKVGNEGCTWVGDNSSGYQLSCDLQVNGVMPSEYIYYTGRGMNDTVPGSILNDPWKDVDDAAKGGNAYYNYTSSPYDYVKVSCGYIQMDITKDVHTSFNKMEYRMTCISQVKSELVRQVRTYWDMQMHRISASHIVARSNSVSGSINISKDPSAILSGSTTWSYSEKVTGQLLVQSINNIVEYANKHVVDVGPSGYAGNCSMSSKIGFFGTALMATEFYLSGGVSQSKVSSDFKERSSEWIGCD